MKKLAVLLLALVTVFTLGSCSKTDNNKKGPEKVALENVFLTEKHSLPEESDIFNIRISGDKIYCKGSRGEEYTDEEGNTQYKNTDTVYVTDKTFSEFKEFYQFESKDYWNELTMESSSEYFDSINPDGMGGLWIGITNYISMPADEDRTEWINENNTMLYHYDAEGNHTRTINCRELLSQAPDSTPQTVSNFYVSSVTQAKDGTVYVLTNSAMATVDTNGNLIGLKEYDDSKNINDLAVLEDGTLRAICYDWSGEEAKAEVVEFDSEANSFKTICTLSVNENIMLDPQGNVYVDDNYVISRVDLATGEKKPMLDWINSDINCDKIFQTVIQDGEVYTFEWNEDYTSRSLLHLTPVAEGEVIEKYIITLAANTISGNLKNMIIDYNRTSVDYRIQVKAYGWEDSDTDKFDMDILAGDVPDLICLDRLNAEKYASKGILADLGAMLDADDEISREDFLPNVIEASEIKGKLYRLPASFSARSLMAKKSIVGDRTSWNWDDFLSVMKQYPNAEMLSEYSRQTLWNDFFPLIIEDFIDYDTGKSNFTDGNFAKFLEYAKSLPEEINWESYYENVDWEEYEDRYKNDQALLVVAYLSSVNGDYYTVENFGEPATYIGFPTCDDNGHAMYFTAQFAIGEKSIYKEQAWDFLKMIFSEEYQTEYVWEVPVIKSAFEQKKQEAIDSVNNMNSQPDYPVDEGVEILPAAENSFVMEKPLLPMPGVENNAETKAGMLEHIAQTADVLTSANRVVRYNDPMVKVISDECQPYFDGKKSLEETCKIIESRVNLYLAETM